MKIKSKAIIEILILVIAIIPLTANVAKAQQNVCCEKTNDGESCIYTDSTNCDSSYHTAAVNCEQTSFCQIGCCYDLENGRCHKNVARRVCAEKKGTWKDDANCNIAQCQKGCCILGNECSFVTQTRCKKEAKPFEDISMIFDESITDELSCINTCRSSEKGACISQDGTCTYTTRGSCSLTSETNVSSILGVQPGFYKDTFCSEPKLGTDCTAKHNKGCLANEDDVYWFDSCGNQEDIAQNCDYAKGSLCGKNTRNESVCLDLNCGKTTKNPASPNSGTAKKLGESWCVFDTDSFFAKDVAGSRHYRFLCVNGQEISEPCKDFREELCIQGVSGESPVTLAESPFKTGEYVEAACRDNRWESCNTCNTADTCGGECDKYRGDDRKACCRKKCCENLYLRDCYWMPSGITNLMLTKDAPEEFNGVCVPHVPPGLKFWETTSETSEITEQTTQTETTPITGKATQTIDQTNKQTTETTQTAAQGVCAKATQECKVVWKRGGMRRLIGGGWECVENCQCLTKDYLKAANTLCVAQGDCGAYYNIKGRFTIDGFSEDFDDISLEAAELMPDWQELIAPKDYGAGKFSRTLKTFLTKVGPALAIPALLGLRKVWGIKGEAGWKAKLKKETLNLHRQPTPSEEGAWAAKKLGQKELEKRVAEKLKDQEFTKGVLDRMKTDPNFIEGVSDRMKKDAIDIIKNSQFDQEVKDTFIKEIEGGMTNLEIMPSQSTEKIIIDLSEEAIQKEVAKEAQEKVLEQATEEAKKKVLEDAVKQMPEKVNWINTLFWVWAIYEIIDWALVEDREETHVISCQPWQPPLGGADCSYCNDRRLKPCSEYICHSLGQNCELVNPGTDQEFCIDTNPNDATSPIIIPDKNILTKGYTLRETTENGVKGYTISPKIKPFTPITFGINTDEPAQCKISLNNSIDYKQMSAQYFPDDLYRFNHSITISPSGAFVEQKIFELTNNAVFTFYVRCQDKKGNENERDYFIRLGVEPGPDLTPPVIELTSINNDAYFPYGYNETFLSVYLNEPANCRWANNDTGYENMHNEFSCSSSPQPIYHGLYGCNTILENIKSNRDNEFFFRCKDQPGKADKDRNVMEESYIYTLRGTSPLQITEISPTGELFYNSPTLRVTTSSGAESGKAACGYSNMDNEFSSMVIFFETNSTSHRQEFINLTGGTYKFYVKCIDLAGNLADADTTFTISADTTAPIITQIFTDGNILHLTLNEDSTCEYSTESSFSYGSGTPMTGITVKDHEATLDAKLYYIICVDQYNNQMPLTKIYP